ncbi:MAG TPA: hypothetical protein VGF74_01585 [Thermoleophilaceae bacterium]
MNKRIAVIVAGVAVAGAAFPALTGGVAGAGSQASSSMPTLSLTLDGRSLTVSGALQSGAVNVVTNVTGSRHTEPILFRLNPGVPASAFAQAGAAVAAHKGDLNYLAPYGSIVFDIAPGTGTSSAQTILQPGNYIAIDLAAAGATPPHAAFTVTQAAQPATLPKPGATITAIDFAFHGARRLHDGELVRFQNSGFVMHQIQGIGVRNPAAAKRLTALLLAGDDRQAPKLGTSFPEFAGPLSPGSYQQERIIEKPGTYVLACIMRTQDGREHTRLGMERTIRIVR